MMRKKALFGFLLYGVSVCGAVDVKSNSVAQAVEDIIQMRELQKTASIHEYYDYEKKIKSLKQEHGNNKVQIEGSFFVLMRDCLHAVPFISWQLACLFLLFFVLYRKRISWIILGLLVIVASMLVVGYYEHKQHWFVVAREGIALRVGPGTSYPFQANLQPLDEVRVLGVRNGWSQIEYNGVIGWIDNELC